MDNLIFKILDWLAPKGIGVLDNIAQPLSEIFIVTDTNNVSTVHEAKKVNFFLDNLISENLIGMPDRPDRSLGERHDTQGYRWLIDWPIGAWITLNGFNLLRQEKLRRAGKDLESSSIRTNESVKMVNRLTIINVIATLFVAGLVLAIQIETNSRERRREKREIEEQRQTKQESQDRKEWEEQLKMSFHQLNQAVLKLDTNVKRVKMVSVK